MKDTVDKLSVEVMAHLLGWVIDKAWLAVRGLNRKWHAAVCCLMEGVLQTQTTSGMWHPSSNAVVRRLLLVCTPLMIPEVLHSVSTVNLSEQCWDDDRKVRSANPYEDYESYPAERTAEFAKLTSFPGLTALNGFRITSMEFQAISKVASLTSLVVHSGDLTNSGLKGLKLELLTSLNLGSCGQITDAALVPIARLPALQSLNLSLCYRITDLGLKEIGKLTSLTSLCLEHCTNITDAGMKEVSKLVSLTSLDVSFCKAITDVGLHEIAKLSALTSLYFKMCALITDAGLLQIAPDLLSLKTLNLYCCSEITEIGFRALANNNRSLTSLDLYGCSKIGEEGLCELRKLDGLVSLNLTWSDATDNVLRALEHQSSLNSLNLTLCEKVTDTGLSYFANLPALATLSVQKCVEITDAGLRSIARVSTLTFLDLSHCTKITDEGVKEVVQLSALKTLYLSYCSKVTDIGLLGLLEMPSLTEVQVSRCDLISSQAVSTVRKRGVKIFEF
jgi:hypothetical protein